MPKRATLTFSSDDNQAAAPVNLYVYYCKYSGRHVLTTDCNIDKAPKRRTDAASVIDTEKYQVKLYALETGPKLIKRRSGAIERQYRLNCGKLPIGYRIEREGRYLYILENSVTSYSVGREQEGSDKPPVPPCITQDESGLCLVKLEVDDHADKASLLKITADYVRVEISGAVTSTEANEVLLELCRRLLNCRLSQLTLVRGESTRHKVLQVLGTTPDAIFNRLQAVLAGEKLRS
mmetsp:Transcript_5159/g.14829  ORF Transcript_5159/g.14829 Transcript_5159/m.14829 type:complete len:235 (-) Transcript_5159:303-1007(-)|eukprot:CAMPEP_0206140310 /NCGR_PEP_ID=MMETSP1473-20131121/9013_1 /ASSEMBLY_ACC=CAM_ASM_001109 /TAXON_ID=1461547 /ORGANISM="Stichococcus sp, Strain RCC1054" /LENGTH=234 /DNA_ID=CAMNT_0053534419 /DNA_START=413 /DNA_END=1117 /DNA_ORIENTATION=+